MTRRDPNPGTAKRSETLLSCATDSTAALPYARSGDSQYSRNENFASVQDASAGRSAHVPQIRLEDRATIYDDDYEEPDASPTLDQAYPPSSPASATLGDVSTEASFTIVRATVLEPDLPKAKCADCGEKLDFQELADHPCQSSSAYRPAMLTIQLPTSSSSSTVSSCATSPGLNTPRSPFFDRYDSLVSDSRPMSPAVFATVTHLETHRGQEEEEVTPKAHAVRVVETQAAIKLSSTKASRPSDHGISREPQEAPPPLPPAAIQRSASDTQADAAARRKMIEQQRAAKVKDMMTCPIPRAATTWSLSKQSAQQSALTDDLSRCASMDACASPSRTTQDRSVPAAPEGQHAKTCSSSSLSSTGTDSSERLGLSMKGSDTREKAAAEITPSSSYERIGDEFGATRTSALATPVKQVGVRGKVDISSIEEMMKDLTASPEPMQPTLPEVAYTSRQTHELGLDASQPPSAVNKSDRERALELELERLRDKERTRQLQAVRLKEKRKRERAAKRCCICDCSLSSSRTPFVERDGKLLCARDWKELYLPKCRKCHLIVEKGAVKSSDGALRGVFHRSCFSCAACETPFKDGSFYVYNHQPYCSRHYHRLNGSLCRECETGIEGDCRQTDTGDRFHSECFRCQYTSKNGTCHTALADYYIVGGQRLCERHAEKVSRRLAKAGQKQLDLRSQKRMTMLHSLR